MAMATPLGRALWHELVDELEKRIADGTLAPGQRLVEHDVAAEFGVSRGPVREAFTELGRRGLLEINARRGAGVRVFTERDIREIFELRECLEVCAIGRAASIEPAALERIREKMLVAAAARRSKDLGSAVAADMEFHRELCNLSDNARLVAAWETQAAQVKVVVSAAHQRPGARVLQVLAEHDKIFEALVDGDVPAAQDRLRRHLRSARDLLLPVARERQGHEE
jgi:DNA-binding GntR family transcriptional regulator